MESPSYPSHFYKTMGETSGDVPSTIVDCILEFVEPKSVVDVGCGVGDFLACFQQRGIVDIQGMDLPVDTKLLRIPPERFSPRDLSRPVQLTRKYDLVVSLEVAEHLPENAADTFVETLTGLGDVIVFSAAVPEQAGFRHINLQWQDYWADKFRSRSFLPVDCIRDRIWRNESVPYFYRQNILMYVQQDALGRFPILQAEQQRTGMNSLSRIHPAFFMEKADPSLANLRFMVRALPNLPRAFIAALKRRVGA